LSKNFRKKKFSKIFPSEADSTFTDEYVDRVLWGDVKHIRNELDAKVAEIRRDHEKYMNGLGEEQRARLLEEKDKQEKADIE
jgi:hypothetical protein